MIETSIYPSEPSHPIPTLPTVRSTKYSFQHRHLWLHFFFPPSLLRPLTLSSSIQLPLLAQVDPINLQQHERPDQCCQASIEKPIRIRSYGVERGTRRLAGLGSLGGLNVRVHVPMFNFPRQIFRWSTYRLATNVVTPVSDRTSMEYLGSAQHLFQGATYLSPLCNNSHIRHTNISSPNLF